MMVFNHRPQAPENHPTCWVNIAYMEHGKQCLKKNKSYLAHAHAPQSILHCAAFSFSPRSHCWNVLRRVHGYGSKFDTTCWDPSLVISRGHSAGGIHVALSKNRGYPQPFEEGDDYPLELGVPYVQIHLPKSSPSGFASHGHIGPVSGDAQKHVANSRQKTLSVLCILSNLSTLLIVQNHPIWQDTGFFLSQSQSQRLTMTQRSKKSLFLTFHLRRCKKRWAQPTSGDVSYSELSKHPESTDCWWGLDSVPQKRSARGLRNQAILRVVGLPRNLGSTMPH